MGGGRVLDARHCGDVIAGRDLQFRGLESIGIQDYLPTSLAAHSTLRRKGHKVRVLGVNSAHRVLP